MKKTIILAVIVGVSLLAHPLTAQSWGATKRLTWTAGYSLRSAVAADSSGSIHVVWHEEIPGNREIYYKKSTDGGGTWGGTRRLTWNPGWSLYPAIEVDSSDNIHVVWQDHTPGNSEIFYRRSTDGGVSWLSIKRLTWNTGSSCSPAIAAGSSSNLHVVWYDKTPGHQVLFHKRSTDGGATWGPAMRLIWSAGEATNPAVAMDSSNGIHVVWYDNSSGGYETYHKKSTDQGVSWTGTKRLTWSGSSYSTKIATDSSNAVYVIWTHGFAEIFYRKSTNGGTTWGSARRITWNSGDSFRPAIAADSGNYIHVVWQDDTPGNYEIYYKRSTNGGSSWTTKRLSWNPVESEFPAITTDTSDRIHVVWEDYTPADFEIFYKRGIQ